MYILDCKSQRKQILSEFIIINELSHNVPTILFAILFIKLNKFVAVLGFYITPTAHVIQRRDLSFNNYQK